MIRVDGVGIMFRLQRHRRVGMQDLVARMFSLNHGHTHWALKDVSFEVAEGEVLGVIGPNGSGKSTLLRVLARIYKPHTGAVEVDGRISTLLTITGSFQAELTGMESIYMNGILMGLKKGEIDVLVPSMLEFADLGEFIDQPIRTYSSGMRTRLGFALAIHARGDVLLMDEVMGAGDTAFHEKAKRAMSRKLREGKTVVLVSHNLDWVREHSHRVLWLDKGRIAAMGDPVQITSQYERAYTTG